MRAFIAIELPQEIKEYLSRLQEKLKSSQADVKWVSPKNIHFTIKFLGEIDKLQKCEVIEALEGICQNNGKFLIRIGSLGGFPNTKSIHVIWIGLSKGDSAVKNLALKIEEALKKIGIPKEEREFSSHITLGRTRSSKNRLELSKALEELATVPPDKIYEFTNSLITLFKSTLTPQGPVYEVIHQGYLNDSSQGKVDSSQAGFIPRLEVQ
jgi:2'-5' RNA ligase